MHLSRHVSLAAPLDAVTRLMEDPVELARLVPGITDVRMPDPDVIEAHLTVRLPVAQLPSQLRGRFIPDGAQRLRLTLTGTPRTLAGRFTVDLVLAWAADGPGRTSVSYSLSTKFFGRLATLGEALVRQTAEEQARMFEENLKRKVEGS
jgi:carbon monoxide dehydrogenase subunit G